MKLIITVGLPGATPWRTHSCVPRVGVPGSGNSTYQRDPVAHALLRAASALMPTL